MYAGFNIKEFFTEVGIPAPRWLTQIARWIGNLRSSDGSVLIQPMDDGINFQVDPRWLATATSGSVVIGQVTSTASTGATSITCSLYGNGVANAATVTGATVAIKPAIGKDYHAGTYVMVRVIKSTTGGADTYECAGVQCYTGATRTIVNGMSWSTGTVNLATGDYALEWSSNGQLQITAPSGASTITLFAMDLSTEIDIAPESRISGGYLQTRCKKIKLVATGSGYPTFALAASSNYGDWVNGPAQTTC
jgi:hypothetical protein